MTGSNQAEKGCRVEKFGALAPSPYIWYAEGPSESLTTHELRRLPLLADGHSGQATADHLAISLTTGRSYIRNVYDKLHVHSKSEAVSKALRSGLIV